MARFRMIATFSVIAVIAAMSPASAETAQPIQTAVAAPVATLNAGFSRCPKTADQYAEVMKQLTRVAARARALADENPLLEPDAAFFQAELAATKTCSPTVATLQH